MTPETGYIVVEYVDDGHVRHHWHEGVLYDSADAAQLAAVEAAEAFFKALDPAESWAADGRRWRVARLELLSPEVAIP